MPTNFYWYFIIALVPMIVGFIYYHEKVLGRTWMNVNKFTDEYLKEANMGVVFGVSYVLSLLFTWFLTSLVIHQGHMVSILYPDVLTAGSEAQATFNSFMEQYGEAHRSFKHGAINGSFISIFFILPIIGINALFERRGWKYILIHFGYWWICLIIMGGLLCHFLEYAPL